MKENESFHTWNDEKIAADIYPKLKTLQQRFQDEFNVLPDFFVRVPGRVNLIGEHIDYCGYSVCPMAIQPDIVIAVKLNSDSVIHIANTSDQYKNMINDIHDLRITADGHSSPLWADYIICGIKGVSEAKFVDRSKFTGLNIMVSGTIPPCAGLSSSSALVCAGALAVTRAFKLQILKTELADIAARSERYIGTEGGGMDQAIIFCAHEGCASHIHFNPLNIRSVHLPSNGTFVIAQSLVTKNKAASSDYNTRVVECRLASLIIGKNSMEIWRPITILSELQNEIKASFEEMINLVERYLTESSYTKSQICDILDVSIDDLEQKFLTPNTKDVAEFKIRQRALHVLQEAYRVEKFCAICNEKSSNAEELGKLMTESHESLKTLYECSHPQLDKLVTCCLEQGAYGARLTGAGWGGCVVALIESAKSEQFISRIKYEFYRELITKDADIDKLIFATKSFSGAGVIDGPLKN